MEARNDTITLTKPEIKALLECAGKDRIRPHLRSLAVELTRDRAYLVTTDGHRLMVASCQRTGNTDQRITTPVVLPREQVESVAKMITKKNHVLQITTDVESSKKVTLDAVQLPPLDKRSDDSQRIRATFDGLGTVLGTMHVDIGESSFPPWRQVVPTDEVQGQHRTSDGPAARKFGFNPKYMQALVLLSKVIGDRSGIECCPGAHELDPILFRACGNDATWGYVLMPMRMVNTPGPIVPTRVSDDEDMRDLEHE